MNRLKYRPHPGQTFLLAIGLVSTIAALGLLVSVAAAKFGSPNVSYLHSRQLEALSDDDDNELCRNVHRAVDQCAFVLENCPDEEAGLFSYLGLYYCRLSNIKPLAFIIIILWAGLLFATISAAASDFFSVNLSTIAALLKMSENLAGVTFLAFGNGSPDVFSTFAAMKSHSGSLAVGELIGAAGFISAVVPGAMALIRPFKTGKGNFIRDVVLLAVAVSFSMVFLANGQLEMWECLVMVVFYVLYATSVVFWHWYIERKRRRRQIQALSRGHFVIPENEEAEVTEQFHDEDDDDNERSDAREISTQDFRDLEEANDEIDDIDDLRTDEERRRWLSELSSNMRVTIPPRGDRTDAITPIRPSLIGALEFQAVLSSLQRSRNNRSIRIRGVRRYSDDPTFTSAQQQGAPAATDEPDGQTVHERSVQNYQTFQDGPVMGTLASRGVAGNRARAVSANDANGLRLNFDLLDTAPQQQNQRKPVVSRHRSNSSRRQQRAPPSPILSVSPPAEQQKGQEQEVEEEAAEQAGGQASRPRSGTFGDFLAPPDQNFLGHQDRVEEPEEDEDLLLNDTQPNRQHSRHSLRITPPGSTSSSRRHTPLQSPLAAYMDDPMARRHSRSGSVLLGRRMSSPERMLSIGSGEEWLSKPLRWWPYSVLPPPDVLAKTLFPTLYLWREKSIWQKILGVVSVPSYFLLTITLPVVGRQDEDTRETPATTPASSYPPIMRGSYKSNSSYPPQPQERFTDEVTPKPDALAHVVVSAEENHNHQPASQPPEPPFPPLHQSSLNSTLDPHNPSAPKEWNRWLVVLQCFTAPWFIVLIIWANHYYPSKYDLLKFTLYSLLASLISVAFVLTTTTPTRPPKWRPVLSFVGFAVSIAWISTIAEEVVGVLKTIGVVCNISDAILGLTIFAVGNSLGDLVADITVARLGHPVMALSACFGGPMLNILLGIGLSGLYVTVAHAEKKHKKHPGKPLKFKPYHIEISTTLLISAIALLITLLGLCIVVPLNGWRMDRRIGIGLITLWAVATVTNVVVEVTGLGGTF